MLRNFYIKHYNGTTWWGNKFLRKFGDKQSSEFYYVMGYSYYKLGRYEKAIKMLEKALKKEYWRDKACLYYTARSCGKMGNTTKYKEYLETIIQKCSESNPSMIERVDWVYVWAQSRLMDMEAATGKGVMLEDIAAFLNLSEEDLDKTYKDNIEWVRLGDPYSEYLYDEMGINIVCYCNDFYCNSEVKYVELDRDKISFRGIDSSMNFEEVMNILGKTEVIANEDGLPGLYSYELRYVFDGVKVRIYSWDRSGGGGIYMSVVDDFLPEYRQIRITPEQISGYFSMTKAELEKELGKGELSYSEEWLEYPEFGASFRYDEQGKQLYAIDLDANYQINDLKMGICLKDVMKIMGKRKIVKWETTEDGTMSEITYKFKNFRLQISSLESEGCWGYWDIMSEKFYGGNRYS